MRAIRLDDLKLFNQVPASVINSLPGESLLTDSALFKVENKGTPDAALKEITFKAWAEPFLLDGYETVDDMPWVYNAHVLQFNATDYLVYGGQEVDNPDMGGSASSNRERSFAGLWRVTEKGEAEEVWSYSFESGGGSIIAWYGRFMVRDYYILQDRRSLTLELSGNGHLVDILEVGEWFMSDGQEFALDAIGLKSNQYIIMGGNRSSLRPLARLPEVPKNSRGSLRGTQFGLIRTVRTRSDGEIVSRVLIELFAPKAK